MQLSSTLPSVAGRQGVRSAFYDELAATLIANPTQYVIISPEDMSPVSLFVRATMLRQAMHLRDVVVTVRSMRDTDSLCVSLRTVPTEAVQA